MATTPSDPLPRIRARAGELIARDRWNRAQVEEHVRERLTALLRHAATQSSFYRERIGDPARAGEIELSDLPSLPKETLVDEWDRIAADPALRLADVEAHIASDRAGEPFAGRFRLFSTSGSTGLRAAIAVEISQFEDWVAACLRQFARCGIRPEDRLVAIGSPSPLHLSRQLFVDFQKGRTGAPQLSVATPLEEMVTALQAYRPEVYVGYPTTAAMLADEQLQGRLDIAPRVMALGSESLTPDIRARVNAAWGIEPVNIYATTEGCLMATSSVADPVALDVNEDQNVLEVVDERNRPVPPGTPGARVLLTSLIGYALPLIRYEVTDRVTLSPRANATGRPWTQVAALEGRAGDVLHLPARGGGTVAVHPFRLGAPISSFPALRAYQLVRAPEDDVRLRVVLRADADAGIAERLRRALVAELEDAGAAQPRVAIEVVDELRRDDGPGAKVPLVAA